MEKRTILTQRTREKARAEENSEREEKKRGLCG
jgi:hypothetical protein